MSPRWRKPLPPPVVAEGQTEVFDADGFTISEPPADTSYLCRECFGRRINPFTIAATVDPRWVIGLCLDCGTRQIFKVIHTPSRKEGTE